MANPFSNIAQIMGNRGMQQAAPAPVDPRQQTMMQQLGITNPLLQQFGNQVGRLAGVDTRSPIQATNAAIAKVKNPDSYEGQLEIAKAIMNVDPIKGAELLAAAEEKRRAQQAALARRESLTRQAKKLGLSSTADMLQNNGDVEEAGKQIRDEEQRQAINRGGRPARLAVAKSAGLPEEAIADIKTGKYDTMDNDQFNEWVSGNDADLAVYRTEGDATPRPFKINKYGQVYDEQEKEWVSPSTLGLQAAPTVTKQLSQADSISAKLTNGAVDSFLELNTEAQDAIQLLEVNKLSEELFQEGIISGFGAEFYVNAAKLGKALGFVPDSVTDKVAATETFFANRGRAVAKVITAFGAGTGLSDQDRKYAAAIVAGEIKLSEQSIKRLLEMERKYSYMAIEKNNKALEHLNKIGGLDANLYEAYILDAPEKTQPPLSDAASKYL